MSLRRAVLEIQAHLIELGYDTELGVGGEPGSIQLTTFYPGLKRSYTVELAESILGLICVDTSGTKFCIPINSLAAQACANLFVINRILTMQHTMTP